MENKEIYFTFAFPFFYSFPLFYVFKTHVAKAQVMKYN